MTTISNQSGLSVGQLEALKLETKELVKAVTATAATTTTGPLIPRFDLESLSFIGVGGGAAGVANATHINSSVVGLGGTNQTNKTVSATTTSSGDTAAPPTSTTGTSVPGATGYLNNPTASPWLHNQQLPSVLIKHEKVEHRIMLFLKAQGKSNREVAEFLGYSDAQVSQVVRQPWFLEALRELLDVIGGDLIQMTLKGAAMDSVVTLIDIRDDIKAPAAVRKAAASDLLDRYLGKPKQSVEVNEKKDPTQRANEIDSKVEDLEARERELQKQLGMYGEG
jgi:hypothetical protein